ncbi:MAG: alginate export family protein [bacterium]|nr:alginate export family protein [bacterium]
MKKMLVIFIGALVVSGWFATAVMAEDSSNLKYGLDIRLRQEYLINVLDLRDGVGKDDNYLRLKISPWAKYNFNNDVSMMLKLTSEPRYFFSSGDVGKGKEITNEEIVIDNLYLDVKDAFGAPLDLRIGRQDFLGTYGEGFVIMDGTPGDGSKTFYFNALKSTWKINKNNSLDLVYINNWHEDHLPVVNDQQIATNNSDESGIVLYGKNKLNDKVTLEPYYIWKREGGYGTTPTLKLHTFGARGVYVPVPWKFRAELAGQIGDYDDSNIDREGIGGYFIAGRKFNDVCLTPEINLGYYYLSGDDPTTTDVEAWDPIFSRWPWLSELYVFTLAKETKTVAYWTNLQTYRASVKLDLSPKTNLSLCYSYLLANENVNGSMFSADGKVRGHLPQIQLNHKFNKSLDGYIIVEELFPGSFYADNSQDHAWFFRWQLQYKFSS